MSSLIEAVKNQNISLVKVLIRDRPLLGTNVNLKDEKGNTALIYALLNNNIEIAKILIKASADVNIKNKIKQSPITISIENNLSIDIIRIILDNGGDPNSVFSTSDTLLMLASWKGNYELVELLLEMGAKPNDMNDHNQNSILYAANEDGAQDIRICSLLIEKGADPFKRDKDNVNAMKYDWIREIYRQYILNKVKELNREQRLAFAKILIDPKYSDVPEELVKKIILLLKVPKYHTWSQGTELLNQTNILLKDMLYDELRKELKNEIYDSLKNQYPGEELDNMIDFYRRQLKILTLTSEQRKELKKKKRTRKQRLGISLGTSDLSSQGSKKKEKEKLKNLKRKNLKNLNQDNSLADGSISSVQLGNQK